MNAILGRVIFTIVALLIWGGINFAISVPATLIGGQTAGQQFNNSDVSYITSTLTINAFTGIGAIITFVFFLVLVAIWWGPFKRLVTGMASAAILLAFFGNPANAYFSTTDKTEAYTILPNESAFWIPDVGTNKDSQAKFESEEFLAANKIAVKRFVIPHHKLSGTGGWASFDAYVPDGRLIIVDRALFSHEWVDAIDRGTSKSKQGFPCQTKEGIDFTVGISIGASVSEENAPKFLYHFGVMAPKGERSTGDVIFTSVYYSRTVADVMEDVGRKMVQTLVCDQVMSRGLDEANEHMRDMMESVKKDATVFLGQVGISLSFIGWADTVTFEPMIQKAINDRYAADKLAPVLATLQALAQLKVQEGEAKGLGDKGLPIVVTPGMLDALLGMVKAVTPPPIVAPAQ